MNIALTFEVLLYLNSYYFGLFAVCEIGMNIVKAINLDLNNFTTDFGVLLGVCLLELFRVILARKGNLTERSKYLFLSKINIFLKCIIIFFSRVANFYSVTLNGSFCCWNSLFHILAIDCFAI